MSRAVVRGAPPALYGFYCWLVRRAWRIMGGRLQATGLEHVPASGPCLIIANHQSYLDPLFLHAVAPRVLHAMAKSTQFASPIMARILAHIYVFPVRRYQIDAQAVRTVLRRLAAGQAVMIYVEGERSWDGRLQPARRGVLKLLLKAGVPVIPCRIDGSYNVMPRWDRKIRPGTVRISFAPPLELPKVDDRASRNRLLTATETTVRQALGGPMD
ncbi:MAG: lysophospholipid acyltransferase family protein [Longimicrobiales bacterium]